MDLRSADGNSDMLQTPTLRSSAGGDMLQDNAERSAIRPSDFEAKPPTSPLMPIEGPSPGFGHGLLTEHLASVRMDLWSSMEQSMSLIKQRAEAFQKETSRQLEADLAELRKENASLRYQLARSQPDATENRTGGTGDTAARLTLQRPQSATRPQSAVGRKRLAYSLTGDLNDVESAEVPRLPGGKMRNPSQHDPQSTEADRMSAARSEPPPQANIFMPPASIRRETVGDMGWSENNTSVLLEDEPQLGHGAWWHTKRFGGDSRARLIGKRSLIKADDAINVEDWTTGARPRTRLRHSWDAKQGVFADAAAMKDRVREALAKPEYNVANYYHDKGCCQAIARHQLFEYATLSVIAVNAVWISIDADYNHQDLLLDADPVFQIAENSFCAYFTFEWVVRFLSFRLKRDCLQDAWFIFDTVLVIIMVMETWVFTVFALASGHGQGSAGVDTSVLKLIRLVRLTRMARMAKLLRAVPELIILIKGIYVAARSVFFTLVLLVLIIYVFAIILRQITDDSEIGKEYYETIPMAMQSLLLDGVLPDQATIVRDNGDSHVALGFCLLIFILLSSLTVMNMLVGVLCEVVSVVSAVEKEQLTVNYVRQRLQSMFLGTAFDQDGSGSISKLEFESMLTSREAAEIIQDLGVDVVGLVDFADHLFAEDDTDLSFADFMELVLQLRGSNNCTVKDMVDLRKFVVTELESKEHRIVEALCFVMNFEAHKVHDFLARSAAMKEYMKDPTQKKMGSMMRRLSSDSIASMASAIDETPERPETTNELPGYTDLA